MNKEREKIANDLFKIQAKLISLAKLLPKIPNIRDDELDAMSVDLHSLSNKVWNARARIIFGETLHKDNEHV